MNIGFKIFQTNILNPPPNLLYCSRKCKISSFVIACFIILSIILQLEAANSTQKNNSTNVTISTNSNNSTVGTSSLNSTNISNTSTVTNSSTVTNNSTNSTKNTTNTNKSSTNNTKNSTNSSSQNNSSTNSTSNSSSIKSSSGRQFTVAIPANKVEYKTSTQFDGVTSDKYVDYLKLNGRNGVVAPLADIGSLSLQLDYTIMMWLKPLVTDWDVPLTYSLQIPGTFECYSQLKQFVCDSSLSPEKLIANSTEITDNVWFHMTVSGKNLIGSYLTLEDHVNILDVDEGTYLILQQQKRGWSACLGACDGSNDGFNGGIRDFVFITQYLTPSTTQRIKNHYLTWDLSIMAYYRFDGVKFNQDEFRATTVSFLSSGSASMHGIDYIVNDICYPFVNYEQFLHITQDYLIAPVVINSRWSPAFRNYGYTMSLTINPTQDICVQPNPLIALKNCSVIIFPDIFMLYFESVTVARFYFIAEDPAFNIQSQQIFIPTNQWINIQVTFTQYSGYTIKTYDLQSRLMQSFTRNYDMEPQFPIHRNISLFNNYRGYIRSFILWSTSMPLPISTPMDQAITNGTCLFYLKLQPKYNTKSMVLTNYGGGTLTQDFSLNSQPTYDQQIWKNFSNSVDQMLGLVTYPYPLFDGIACNDSALTLQIQNTNSFIQTQTPKYYDTILDQATVEFWVRPNKLSNIKYLFQMYSNGSKSEYLSIYMSSSLNQLICAPFGVLSIASPYISFSDFTDQNAANSSWFHLACSYSYQNTVQGYLKKGDISKVYSIDISNSQSYIPSDPMNILIGNSNSKTMGSVNALFKDLRLWGVQRTQQEIESWRYRQINPLSYSMGELLIYLRMGEANYKEFNYESINNPALQPYAWSNNIGYQSDYQIVVCPQQTYYSNNSCYFNPISLIVGAIFPVYDYDNQILNWLFTLNNSGILNTTIWPELITSWQINDPVIQAVTKTDISSMDLLIPSSAFADQQVYNFVANITNNASAFEEIQEIQFIPVSCHWIIVQGSNSYQAYNLYQTPQSTKDISFILQIQNDGDDCKTFYDTMVPNITYKITPPPVQMPILQISNIDSSTIQVVIPKAEQSKLPLSVDVKIIMSIFWVNSQYEQYESLSEMMQYTFQNVMYTINFAFESMTVVTIVNSNLPYALQGDQIILDASQSYVTSVPDAIKHQNLSYLWACPQQLSTLCQSESTLSALRINYQDFVQAGGSFNQTYQFYIEVDWTTPSGDELQFYDTISMIWYNQVRPDFQIIAPQTIVTSNINDFQLTFNNINSTSIISYSIQWQILPNLAVKTLNTTQNNTVLEIPQGTFQTNTTYFIIATVQSKINTIIQSTQKMNFSTSLPPYGGVAKITPLQGYLNYTTFTIYLSNWQSEHPPIQYQVWQTSGPSSNTPQTQLSLGWLNVSQNFSFEAESSNPFVIVVTDSSQELAYSKKFTANITLLPSVVTPILTPSNSTNSSSNNKNNNSQKTNATNATNATIANTTQSNRSNSSNSSTPPINNSSSSNNTNKSNSSNSTVNSTNSTTKTLNAANGIVNLLSISSNDYQSKYQYLQMAATQIKSKEDVGQQSIAIQNIIDQLYQDSQQICNRQLINNGNSKIILLNSVQVMGNILQDPTNLNNNIVEEVLQTIQNLQNSSQFVQYLQENVQFMNNYANILSYIQTYVKYSQQLNSRRRRNLQTSDITIIYSALNDQLDYLADNLCATIQTDSQYQIYTQSFNLIIYSISPDSEVQTIQISNQNEPQTLIEVDVQNLQDDIQYLDNIDYSEFLCAQAYFFKQFTLNLQTTQQDISQYSSLIEFEIIDTSFNQLSQYLDLQLFSSMYFQLYPETFQNNQTICMQNVNQENYWDSSQCQTYLYEENFQIQCYCAIKNQALYGLFVDSSRIQGEQIYNTIQIQNSSDTQQVQSTIQNSNLQIQSIIEHSLSYISLIMTLLVISLIIPIIAIYLDKKDTRYAQKKLLKGHKHQLLMAIANISKEPFSYWVYKQDQVMTYSIQSTSIFSHLFSQMHPFFSIFSKFDIQESRITRFSVFLLQLSCFSLFATLVFGPYYRQNDKNDDKGSLDAKDITSIIWVGLVGMLMLLPLPCTTKCLRSKLFKKSPSDKQLTNQSSNIKILGQNRTNQEYLPQFTSEQFNFNQSPVTAKQQQQSSHQGCQIQDDNIYDKEQKRKNQYQQQKEEQLSHEILFLPQCIFVKYFLFSISYLLNTITIILVIVFAQQAQLYQQYCLVSSFYIGLIGSLLISNVVRISLNSILVERVSGNKYSICKLIVSEDAIRIYQEIQYVKEADSCLSFINSYSEKSIQNNNHNHNHTIEDCTQNRLQVFKIKDDFDDIKLEEKSDGNQEEKSNEFTVTQQMNNLSKIIQASKIDREVVCQSPTSNKRLSSSIQSKRSDNSNQKGDENAQTRKSVVERVKSSIEKKYDKKHLIKYSCVTENEKSCEREMQEQENAEKSIE